MQKKKLSNGAIKFLVAYLVALAMILGIRLIPAQFPAMQMVMPVGGFLVLGFVIAGSQKLMKTLEKKNKKKEAAK